MVQVVDAVTTLSVRTETVPHVKVNHWTVVILCMLTSCILTFIVLDIVVPVEEEESEESESETGGLQ